MNALCNLCKTNIVATDKIQLHILILAHILMNHYTEPKYEQILLSLVETAQDDFEISEDAKLFKGDKLRMDE